MLTIKTLSNEVDWPGILPFWMHEKRTYYFHFFPKNSWSRSGQESSRSSKIQSQDIIDELYALNGTRYKDKEQNRKATGILPGWSGPEDPWKLNAHVLLDRTFTQKGEIWGLSLQVDDSALSVQTSCSLVRRLFLLRKWILECFWVISQKPQKKKKHSKAGRYVSGNVSLKEANSGGILVRGHTSYSVTKEKHLVWDYFRKKEQEKKSSKRKNPSPVKKRKHL